MCEQECAHSLQANTEKNSNIRYENSKYDCICLKTPMQICCYIH